MSNKEEATYLGDGVYACNENGHGIRLLDNHHEYSRATDKIYLEPEVLRALVAYAKLKGYTL